MWEKELDDLFRTLRDPQDEGVSSTEKDPSCPLHTHVSLKKKVSKRGWEYVRCSEKNCLIWLPWDRHLSYVLSEVQHKMHPVLRQGFFYCFCREPCKVGLTKRLESPNRGRCFLTCAQKKCTTSRVSIFPVDRRGLGSPQYRFTNVYVQRSIKCSKTRCVLFCVSWFKP